MQKLNELLSQISSSKQALLRNPGQALDDSESKLQWLQRELKAPRRSELNELLDDVDITPAMIRSYSKEALLQKIKVSLQEGGARKRGIVNNSEACHSRRRRNRRSNGDRRSRRKRRT